MAPRERLTVEEMMGETEPLEFDVSSFQNIQPDDIWANYDAITDSLVVYVTGKPVPGVNVWQIADQYVIVDPDTSKAVGIYIEAFEKEYIAKNEELRQSWLPVKNSFSPQDGWNQLLRVFAFWLVTMMTSVGNTNATDMSFQAA